MQRWASTSKEPNYQEVDHHLISPSIVLGEMICLPCQISVSLDKEAGMCQRIALLGLRTHLGHVLQVPNDPS